MKEEDVNVYTPRTICTIWVFCIRVAFQLCTSLYLFETKSFFLGLDSCFVVPRVLQSRGILIIARLPILHGTYQWSRFQCSVGLLSPSRFLFLAPIPYFSCPCIKDISSLRSAFNLRLQVPCRYCLNLSELLTSLRHALKMKNHSSSEVTMLCEPVLMASCCQTCL